MREAREEAERKHRQALIEAQKVAEAKAAAAASQAALRLRACSWGRAVELRKYVAAVREAISQGAIEVSATDAEDWLAWAEAHADELDPIKSGRAISLARLDIDQETPPSGDSRPWFSKSLGREIGANWPHSWWKG